MHHYWRLATTRPNWGKTSMRPPTTHIRSTSFSFRIKKPGSSKSLGKASEIIRKLATRSARENCLRKLKRAQIELPPDFQSKPEAELNPYPSGQRRIRHPERLGVA